MFYELVLQTLLLFMRSLLMLILYWIRSHRSRLNGNYKDVWVSKISKPLYLFAYAFAEWLHKYL